MTASTLTNWSVKAFNRHFERPLARSLPFLLVTALFILALVREAWALAARWPAPPPGGAIRFASVVLMTPLLWLAGILQHRRRRARASDLRAPLQRGLTIAGAMAADYLYAATVGYLLLVLVLSLVPR